MELTEDMEEELNTMCNLSEGIAEKYFKKGEITILLRLWQTEKNIDKLVAISGWTKQQIQDMLKEHKLI